MLSHESPTGSARRLADVLSRRHALGALGGGLMLTALGASGEVHDSAPARTQPRIAGFTKPLQHLSFEETARVCRRVGWDGVEVPVRPGGQIEPKRAADELPRFAEALAGEERQVLVLATAIVSPDSPDAEAMLRTAASLGIRDFRMGWYRYDPALPPGEQLPGFASQLRDLADMCCDIGVRALYHNHSGAAFVGAPVWDAVELVGETDPKAAALMFDVGHATVEGGLAWPLHLRHARKWIGALCVKDFAWQRGGDGRWRPVWKPLGQGMVGPDIVRDAAGEDFSGTIVQHHEYPEVEGGAATDLEGAVRWMQRDLAALRHWLNGESA